MVRMGVLAILCAMIAAPGLNHAQARPAMDDSAGAGNDAAQDIREDLNQVRAVIRQQAELLEKQRLQIERQQAEIDELRSHAGLVSANDETSGVEAAARLTREVQAIKAADPQPPAMSSAHLRPAVLERTASAPQQGGEGADRPLSIHFGRASLTPGGWVDFTSYFRSRDVGSGLGTSFATIPFRDTVQGGLSELRFTAQNSRITLRADERLNGTRVFGYAEADFNGSLPANAYVSTNSDSLRLRVYFTDVARGRWEILGGQSWSLLTPNRVGISPFLSEIYNTLHLDSNYQVGLTYARQTQFRVVYHFTPQAALGLSAENPQQYSGSAVTFPALFSTSQTDTNSSTGGGTATPTLHPDLIAKFAADTNWAQRRWHFEVSGLLTPVAILSPVSITQTESTKDIREGGGIAAAANLQAAKSLHVILSGFWSDGGGRYIGGLGPGFAVAQRGSTSSPFAIQLVHSGSGIAALEWQATRASVLSLTFSQAYFGRAFSTDPSTGNLVGYGFAGSANSNNRALGEGTFATQTTLWKQAGYGSVQMITQSSYITRAPWYVAPQSPSRAHIFDGYANLRYVLP